MANSTISDEWGNFTPLPDTFIEQAASLTDAARWLFVLLRYHTNRKQKCAFPSYKMLRTETTWNYTKIAAAVRCLEASGWLTRTRSFGKNTHYILRRPSSVDPSITHPDNALLEPDSPTLQRSNDSPTQDHRHSPTLGRRTVSMYGPRLSLPRESSARAREGENCGTTASAPLGDEPLSVDHAPLDVALLEGAGFTPDQGETLSPGNWAKLKAAATRLSAAGVTVAHVQGVIWPFARKPTFDQLADEAVKVRNGTDTLPPFSPNGSAGTRFVAWVSGWRDGGVLTAVEAAEIVRVGALLDAQVGNLSLAVWRERGWTPARFEVYWRAAVQGDYIPKPATVAKHWPKFVEAG